jgi:hypothetical protein
MFLACIILFSEIFVTYIILSWNTNLYVAYYNTTKYNSK